MSHTRRVLRSPTLLRRKTKQVPVNEKVQLEKVLGLTVQNNATLGVDPNTGVIAYPAGCVVVLYNPKKNRQRHIFNHGRKTITCLAFSGDGKHLVTGECGHQPAVRVWDVEEATQVAEFHGHKFGINCVAFHPNLKYVVSIGSQHDMAVNVWNWRASVKVASNKLATKVTGLAFSEDGSCFVTSGNRHVKFWYLDASKSKVIETVPLMGRSGILGDQKNNCFSDVVMGKGRNSNKTYVITQSGLLCEFNEKRLLDKWVELRTNKAQCICASEDKLFIGCADGIVRVFSPDTLHFMLSLPRPHHLGVNVAAGKDPSHMLSGAGQKHPSTIAIVLDSKNHKVTAVYNDHSLYVWDVRDIKKVGKVRSSLYHSGCIWGLDMYPEVDEDAPLPPGSFITCSSDDTIRIWNIDTGQTFKHKNIYSEELLKIIYADDDLTSIMNNEFNPAGTTDKTDNQTLDKNGVRAIRVSPTGRQLASGDRLGNIRIYDMQTWNEISSFEAHDSEVLCLEYTEVEAGINLLASASRDRLIHVFDADQQYGLIQTLDDHSAAITAVRFLDKDGSLQMISCGADKSLLFRSAQQDPDFQFVLNRHLVGKTTLYDMVIDPTKKFVATACQDRNVRIYNITNGKQKKSYKGATSDDGTLIKVQLDPSGAYVATSCSDKNLAIFDFFTGECAATMFGHSELVTGVKFTQDLKRVISVSGDGCIFVWRLPTELTEHMQNRMLDLGKMPQDLSTDTGSLLSEDGQFVPASILAKESSNDNFLEQSMSQKPPGYRFSVGQLPSWAKKQVQEGNQDTGSKESKWPNTGTSLPKGRWAARVENVPPIKSVLDKSTLSISMTDGVETTNMVNLRRETVLIPRNEAMKNAPVIEQIDDDENNKDDDDDDEFTSIREMGGDRFDADFVSQDMDSRVTTRLSNKVGSPGMFRQVFGRLQSMDKDDEEDEGPVIYLPSEQGSESSETSSFPVHEGDTTSAKDTESEGTHESEEESDLATPTTPIDPTVGFMEAAEREQFLEINFENLANSVLDSSFQLNPDGLSALDRTMTLPESRFQHPRLSISARFLSRAQQQQLRQLQMEHATQQRSQSPALKNSDVPTERSGRSRISLGTEKTKNGDDNKGLTSFGSELGDSPSRKWKSLWDVGDKKRRSESVLAAPTTPTSITPKMKPRSKTPTPRSSSEGLRAPSPLRQGHVRVRVKKKLSLPSKLQMPRVKVRRTSGKMDQSPTRSRSSLGSKEDESEGQNGRRDSTPTRYSRAGRPRSYQQATESSLAKNKSMSTTSLNKPDLSVKDSKASSTSRERRSRAKGGKFNSDLKNKFKSTPDLLNADNDRDEEEEEDKFILEPRTMEDVPFTTSTLNRYEMKTRAAARRSMPATKLTDPFTPISTENLAERGPRKSSIGFEDADRLAMPPPPAIPSNKQEMFMKKSMQSRKTGKTDMTLDQAKAILLGKTSTSSGTDSEADLKPVKDTTPVVSNSSFPASKTTYSTYLSNNNHLKDLDASPNEPPVKDTSHQRSTPERRPTSPTKVPLGGRISPFVGHKRDMFEPNQWGDTPPGRNARRLPDVPKSEPSSAENSPSEGSPTRTRAQFRPDKTFILEHNNSIENAEDTSGSVQDRISLFELKSPQLKRNDMGGRWRRDRNSVAGEGDDAGLSSDPGSPKGPLSPRRSSVPHSNSADSISSNSSSSSAASTTQQPTRSYSVPTLSMPRSLKNHGTVLSSVSSITISSIKTSTKPTTTTTTAAITTPITTVTASGANISSELTSASEAVNNSTQPTTNQTTTKTEAEQPQAPPRRRGTPEPTLRRDAPKVIPSTSTRLSLVEERDELMDESKQRDLQQKQQAEQPLSPQRTLTQLSPRSLQRSLTSLQSKPILKDSSVQKPVEPVQVQEYPIDLSEDEEIKRPDKTVTSPPTSLLMTSPINSGSRVVLNPPTPSTSVIASPSSAPISSPAAPVDRSKLNLPITSPSRSESPPNEEDCITAVTNMEKAIGNVTSMFDKLSNYQTKVTEKAILTAGLEESFKKMKAFIPEEIPPPVVPTTRPPLDPETRSLLKQYSEEMINQVVGLLKNRIEPQ